MSARPPVCGGGWCLCLCGRAWNPACMKAAAISLSPLLPCSRRMATLGGGGASPPCWPHQARQRERTEEEVSDLGKVQSVCMGGGGGVWVCMHAPGPGWSVALLIRRRARASEAAAAGR